MKITLHGALTATDLTKRTLTYLLLPYGEEGNTSAGKVTASAGTITLPTDPTSMILNIEHEKLQPVGRGASLVDSPSGLLASFVVSATSAGNDLLVEANDGLRTGISVEVDNPVIRAGALIGGALTGAGAVVAPAFPSARLVASDTGEVAATVDTTAPMPDQIASLDQRVSAIEDALTPPAAAASETDPEDPDSETSDEDDDENEEPSVKTATASLAASAASGKPENVIKTTADFVNRLTAATKTGDRTLLAALADITQAGVGGDVTAQQFLGELWSGKGYQRVVVPLVQGGSLTSYSVKGWRWTKGSKPQVDTYAGNKGAVSSNSVDTEPLTVAAERLAGGHDLDRKFADFGDTEFLSSYLAALTESYARKTDSILTAFLQSSATVVSAGAVPTDIANAAGALVDGALAVLPMGVPNFALVSTGAYRALLLTPRDQVLEMLSMALGLEQGTAIGFKVVPRADLLPGQVIVGCTPAVQFLELPGVPIRVDALNIANGGVDEGLFGYFAKILHNADGLASVTLAAASIDAGADFAMTVGDADGSKGPSVWATYSDGSKIDITADPACVLTSGTPTKATIVANKVHAVAAGTSVITATYQGKTDTATVTVS